MAILSFFLRIIAVIAAAISITIFILGGNKLKSLSSELETTSVQLQEARSQNQVANEKYDKLKGHMDQTALELATLKRDQRVKENDVLTVAQELEYTKKRLVASEESKSALFDHNEDLRKEILELKAQAFDPNNNPERLLATIEEQDSVINKLRDELRDAKLVLESLFANAAEPDQKVPSRGFARIQKVVINKGLLLLEVGSVGGIRKNAEFDLMYRGNVIAKVKAARVTSNLSVVNILPQSQNPEQLRAGSEIEYIIQS